MKTLLALLISCLTLSAATTYPVLTDSANRTFPGGVTNVFFLNSNVVTTGTMRATGVLTLTNSGNSISATNIQFYNKVFSSAGTGSTDYFLNNFSGSHWVNAPSGGYVHLGVADAWGVAVRSDKIGVAHNYSIAWTSSNPVATPDTAIYRASAGLLEINSGTASEYRDLLARSLYATNLYATNLIINGGATVTKILSATASLNFDLTALTVEDLTITVTGAADGDVVTLGVPNGSITTSVQYTAWVSAADTVTVRARTSAAGENPASGTFRATVIKH